MWVWTTVIVAIVITLAVIAWMLLVRKHPETASGHEQPDRHGADEIYGNRTDRPAGPDAESQAADPSP